MKLLVSACLTVCCFASLPAADPKPLKALLVLGGCCHDYAKQKELLKAGIEARAHIIVDIDFSADKSTKATFERYRKADWAKDYDVIIHDECSADVKDKDYVATVLAAHENGIPAVNLHCAFHSYRTGTDVWFRFCGIQSASHGPQLPIAVKIVAEKHPTMIGSADWTTINEELYNNIKVFETATILAKGTQKLPKGDVESAVIWTNQYGKTRVFNTTLGHNNATVDDPKYLRIVTRGILWACDKLNDDYLKVEPKEMPKPPAPKVEPKATPKVELPNARPNLARAGKATASSFQTGPPHPAEHAIDGSDETRWCANGGKFPQWLQVDLGKVEKITGVSVHWENRDYIYRYKVEGSSDGQAWKTLLDASDNTTKGTRSDDFAAETRFVRIIALEATHGWASIWEVEVFGQPGAVGVAPLPVQPKGAGPTMATLLKDVKAPAEFDVTIFATPDQANYPVFVAAAPDGTLYVSSDQNGSLDRKPNRGRILRLRDTDGDGKADEVKVFAEVDSPRGLVWDHDRLYVIHPPHLSVFIDKDGDGRAEEKITLVKNLAFTFKDRPADHTTNGLTLGIDGWLYVAVGDFGFMEAEGTDGRKVQLRAGGVVRVRPDGTGLHVFARGTRNILEVALSPLLDGITRDNTNDGGGWDVRLHHITGGEDHGYPSLYKNFAAEGVAPLADFGGGSGCGACWIDEPGIPKAWNNAPITVDWGRGASFLHPLKVNGSTYTATQTEFFKLSRATDLDIDAHSHIYASSWRDGSFTYSTPFVGYIARLAPKGYVSPSLPDYAKLSDTGLVKELESNSHRRRLEAQRTLLRRSLTEPTKDALFTLASDPSKPLPSRIAALFALSLRRSDVLAKLEADPTIAAWLIRAYGDDFTNIQLVPLDPIIKGLSSEDGRTRREAVSALARLQIQQTAGNLLPRVADTDPLIAHTAIRAVAGMQRNDVCFQVLDNPESSNALREGTLRALAGMHTLPTVDGLLQRLNREPNPERRRGIIAALCRLYHREGPWKGDSWSTRPDTRGPYYQPETWAGTERIHNALQPIMAKATGEDATFLAFTFARNRMNPGDGAARLIELAKTDPAIAATVVEHLLTAEIVPESAGDLLISIVRNDKAPPKQRLAASIAAAKLGTPAALAAVLPALPTSTKSGGEAFDRLLRTYLAAPQLESLHAKCEQLAASTEPTAEWAEATLIALSTRANLSPEAKSTIAASLDAGWSNPKRRVQMLKAMIVARDPSRAQQVIPLLKDADPATATAAKALFTAFGLTPASVLAEAQAPKLGVRKAQEILPDVVQKSGNVLRGEHLFTKIGCVNCHTVRQDQPQLGPYLGNIGKTYKRFELAEAILLPNKTIAQGFNTNIFDMNDGKSITGYVTREAADEVRVRDANGKEYTLRKRDIEERRKSDQSVMPEGLVAGLTLEEFAALVSYLESLSAGEKK